MVPERRSPETGGRESPHHEESAECDDEADGQGRGEQRLLAPHRGDRQMPDRCRMYRPDSLGPADRDEPRRDGCKE